MTEKERRLCEEVKSLEGLSPAEKIRRIEQITGVNPITLKKVKK